MNKISDIKAKYDVTDYVPQEVIIPELENLNGIILIVGSSGSGKSTILKKYGLKKSKGLSKKNPIIEQFSSLVRGEELLLSMGLRSIPTWFRTIKQISNGEWHRAENAFAIDNNVKVIDEFTSVVDRNTAMSLSISMRKNFNKFKMNKLIVASCHRDIIEWLEPDHIYDTDICEFILKDSYRRKPIKIEIKASTNKDWVYFKKHHYLDSTMSKSVHCYTAYIDNTMVGFLSIIHGCGRDIKTYWRECRLVVLPEFQGLGIGKSLSNTIGSEYVKRGLRYFSKTAHPTLGEYRNQSQLWRATSTNMIKRRSYLTKDGKPRVSKGFGKTKESILRDANRLTYSHEYIGEELK